MAKINFTPQFKRDYKKLKRKHYDTNKLKHVINLLVEVYKIHKGQLELLTIDLISTGSHNHSYRT